MLKRFPLHWRLTPSSQSNTTGSQHVASLHRYRPLLVAVFSMLLLALFFQGTARAASSAISYSCGDTTNHCYSEIDWSGATNGVKTSIFTNQIWGGNCLVNNETWLVQDTASSSYWVEAGVTSSDQYGQDSDALFWADMRPTGLGLAVHLGAFLENNDFGHFANVTISKIASDQFAVSITGLPQASLSGTSTANPIAPNRIVIGMELCGNYGASAPVNGFTNNLYQDPHNGYWYYQTNSGSQHAAGAVNPTVGYWYSPPTGTNHGGDFRTCIAS